MQKNFSYPIKIEDLKQLQIELDQLEKLGADSVSIAYSASANSEKAEALSAKTAIILAEDFYFRTVYMGFLLLEDLRAVRSAI